MSQRADRRTLSLRLSPMSVPNPPNVGEAALATWGALAETGPTTQTSLCVCPGEVAELVIRLEHRGEGLLNYRLQITGNIPDHWYGLYTEGTVLQREHPLEAVLRFRPDADFFEARDNLTPEQVLTLSYHGEVRVYNEATDELLVSDRFRLFIRPRSVYPQFLPAVYREVDFIGRLMKIFEESFEPAVNTLQTLWAYLDPMTAPEALLPFLAQWVGWQNESAWTVEQQRSLIKRAIEIYRWRGTRRGLQFYLHIYTGLPMHHPTRSPQQQPIQIQTASRRGFVVGETELGPMAILGGGKPFHFHVRLCPDLDHWIDEGLVRKIIEQEKPAVCTYDLEIVPTPLTALPPIQETVHG
ncbi:MAG: phage tail protein [Leptolyngbyaceae cyanobacterium bins.349]|nr:phage tail protein [Leptolyngbyaceae cyanobacterium bins.349]